MKNITMRIFMSAVGIVALFAFARCNNQSSSTNVVSLTATQYQDSISSNDGVKIIDIRTPQEFSKGSLDKAVNVDYNSPSFKDNLEWMDKTSPVYIYCQSGGRTKEAVAVMTDMGFERIFVLEGGLLAWRNANLPFTEVADKNVAGLTDPESVSPDAFDKIVAQHQNVIIDFKAEWCGPCKKISPILEKLEKANAGKFVVYKIDTDKSPDLARKMGINSIPHLMVYNEGKKVDDIIGFANEAQLSAQILKQYQ